MSSQPPDPDTSEPRPVPTKWPRWRITMLAGAILLLAVTIADAAIDAFPSGLYGAAFFIGYMLLAYGFFLAMNARREASQKKRDE